jgi:hypothetical protein
MFKKTPPNQGRILGIIMSPSCKIFLSDPISITSSQSTKLLNLLSMLSMSTKVSDFSNPPLDSFLVSIGSKIFFNLTLFFAKNIFDPWISKKYL